MGVVNTTYTFTSTDTITSAKMNNIIDDTTFTGDAIQGTTLQVVSPGKLAVSAGGITSNELASGAVTTNAIADGAVTPAKLATGGPAWSGTTGSIVIKQPALELGEGITSNNASLIDFHSSFPIIDNDARIIRDSGENGWFAIQNQGEGRISFSSAGGFQFANAHMPNPVGTAPIFGVRAWVNFNGISGSVAKRQDGNVDSVSRTGTGQYTINLTTPMADTNYAIVGFARDAGTSPGNYFVSAVSNGTKTTSSFQIRVHSTGGLVDSPEIDIMVIR
jgi:hypothetical protein